MSVFESQFQDNFAAVAEPIPFNLTQMTLSVTLLNFYNRLKKQNTP